MSNVFITGTNGFIGKRLLSHLQNKGYTVVAEDDEYFLGPNWGDVLRLKLIDANPTAVFHVGACSDTLEQDVQYMMTRNFESTKVISDWCFQNKRPLIYSSSAANYGVNGIYPSNLYGWSKYVSEQYVIKNQGIALRYFNVYGPGEENKGKMASFLFQAFLKNKAGENIQLFPRKPLRDFIFIEDVISANCFALANYKNLQGSYYEVSTGQANSFEDMLEKFGLRYEYLEESMIPKGYQFYTCGDPNKWLTGWAPSFSLEAGVREYRSYLIEGTKN